MYRVSAMSDIPPYEFHDGLPDRYFQLSIDQNSGTLLCKTPTRKVLIPSQWSHGFKYLLQAMMFPIESSLSFSSDFDCH